MNRFIKSVLGGLLVLGLTQGADAASIYMCQSDTTGASSGSRTVGGTLSQVPSGTVYVLNGQGCTLVTSTDVGWFASQGYVQSSSEQVFIFRTGVQTGTTDLVIGNLPAKAYLKRIIFSNQTANAVTGGISIGSTANGTNIVAAQTMAASTDIATPVASILLQVPSTTGATTPLHAAAVTAWNSADVIITVVYGYY
jgi:hypothetical protein